MTTKFKETTLDDLLAVGLEICQELRTLNAHREALSAGRRLEGSRATMGITDELGSGDSLSTKSLTDDPRLSDTIGQYLAQKQHEVSPQHLEVARLTLRGFAAHYDDSGIDPRILAISRAVVTAYRQGLLDAGRAIKTVNNHLGIM